MSADRLMTVYRGEADSNAVISCTPLSSLRTLRVGKGKGGIPMPSLIPDFATLERRLAGLPLVKYRAGEIVLTAGSKTNELLFLRSGSVEVVKDGVQIASVLVPGSVFGEQAVLLDQPHTADVRTQEQSEFYVADAQAILGSDPAVAIYSQIDKKREPCRFGLCE
jgi:CRP-like cAMP-binding protein